MMLPRGSRIKILISSRQSRFGTLLTGPAMAAFAILFSMYLWSLVVSQDPDDPQKCGVWVNRVPRNMNV